MAAAAVEPAPAQQASQIEQTPNLLDVVLDKVTKAGKGAVVARLIFVARLSKGRELSADSYKAAYTRLLEKHNVGDQVEITGLLLVYPICHVHVVEAKTSTLLAFMRDMVTHIPDVRHTESRVISCTEDIPSRHFSSWYSTYVPSSSSAEVMDALDVASAVKSASSINAFFRKVGPSLKDPYDAETKRRLSALESYYDEVPSLEALLSLCPTEDAPTLEEFLDIFDGPVNVDLESEQVWPAPPPLNF